MLGMVHIKNYVIMIYQIIILGSIQILQIIIIFDILI